jgi:hypothetical protein
MNHEGRVHEAGWQSQNQSVPHERDRGLTTQLPLLPEGPFVRKMHTLYSPSVCHYQNQDHVEDNGQVHYSLSATIATPLRLAQLKLFVTRDVIA